MLLWFLHIMTFPAVFFFLVLLTWITLTIFYCFFRPTNSNFFLLISFTMSRLLKRYFSFGLFLFRHSAVAVCGSRHNRSIYIYIYYMYILKLFLLKPSVFNKTPKAAIISSTLHTATTTLRISISLCLAEIVPEKSGPCNSVVELSPSKL